ncbi:MAG TPA: radical SAM protein, partial [Anaerolineaceae bacterium]|nr:radical SAM protein [Anaerolineaceae bacterium]
MLDRWGRNIDYLRISVTDRCNFRCVYCMPPQGVQWRPHESVLRYEEIAEVVRVAAGEGIRRIRLTGGEPLVRAGLDRLVAMLSAIPGIDDIA